jgi:hypothetical protein
MIAGFSSHGTGGGKGPTEYLTNPLRAGREDSPPVTVRGDPELTKNLIDSLDFKWKYTSGVLSFAPNEIITPKMESNIIDRFETVAFAGLGNDQYNILWVRHSHAGHHELHFVTPRVELETGKSLNIKPPGNRAQEHFDDFRSEINAKYGLADPADPDRAKNVSSPNHELKIAAEALRKGEKAPNNMRYLIDAVLTQRAVKGLIRSREDVLKHVGQLGFEITREGKNYITVRDPTSEGRWRLKGGLYAEKFEPSAAIEGATIARERDYSRPDTGASRQYAGRVERHISARAAYNHSRYPRAEQAIGEPSPSNMAMGRFDDNNHAISLIRPHLVARPDASGEPEIDRPTRNATLENGGNGVEADIQNLWRSEVPSASDRHGKLVGRRRPILHPTGVLSQNKETDQLLNKIRETMKYDGIREIISSLAQATRDSISRVRDSIDQVVRGSRQIADVERYKSTAELARRAESVSELSTLHGHSSQEP